MYTKIIKYFTLRLLCLFFLSCVMSTQLAAEESKPTDEIRNTLINITLGVDYNRDGKIEFKTKEASFKPTGDTVNYDSPYVFWLNDDGDDSQSETDGMDVPGEGRGWGNTLNHESTIIDGTRDLIDFFPVAINLVQYFDNIFDKVSSDSGEKEQYTIKLMHENEAVNVVYTEMQPSDVDDYLQEVEQGNTGDVFGDWQANKVSAIKTHKVTEEGIELPDDFITFMKDNTKQGVILVEARAVTDSDVPLVLKIFNSKDKMIAKAELPLKLVEVEEMYAQVDIRGLVVKDGESPNNGTTSLITKLKDDQEAIIENKNVPESFDATKHFVFLHGFQVDEESARAWHAEMFKRLFQSGSNAMYVGFSWDSDEGFSSGKINYWGNVENAFNSAELVSNVISNGLSGSVTTAAHSLGNMVLGQAIQQYGLRPNHYFMLNPAVPTEAYNGAQFAGKGTTGQNLMAIPDWHDFYDDANPRRLWSSDWYRLFIDNAGDKRKELTWRDLFVNVPNGSLYNFYSTGEDVLAQSDGSEYTSWDTLWNNNGGIGANAWVIQEHQKGRLTLASGLSGAEGGWGFNCREDQWDWVPNFACLDNSGLDTTEAFALTEAQLRLRPFAKPFSQGDLFSDDISIANKAVDDFKDHTLAFGVPALSHAAGSIGLSEDLVPIKNTDMNTQFKIDWPAERGSAQVDKGWRHSDAKNVAYRYVYKLYDTWVKKGNLNK